MPKNRMDHHLVATDAALGDADIAVSMGDCGEAFERLIAAAGHFSRARTGNPSHLQRVLQDFNGVRAHFTIRCLRRVRPEPRF